MEAKLPSNCSFVWRSLLWGRELLQKGLMWQIGDGSKIKVFSDVWLPNRTLGKIFTKPVGNAEVRVADLMNSNKQWDAQKIEEILLPVDRMEIIRIEVPHERNIDTRYWKFDQKGVHNVKTGYLVATDYYTECGQHWSTIPHALIFCDRIRERWKNFQFWHVLKRFRELSMEDIGENMRNAVGDKEFRKWLVGMWITWTDICKEKHDDCTIKWIDLESACDLLLNSYDDAKMRMALKNYLLPKEGDANWKPPVHGRFRLDIDYSVDDVVGKGGIGAIVRNWENKTIVALAQPTQMMATILLGELRAITCGIGLCVEKMIAPVEVFTDSLLAIHIIAEQDSTKNLLCGGLLTTIVAAKNNSVLSINHMRREANGVAHELARFARTLDSQMVWTDNWPSWLTNVVNLDAS